MNMKNEKCLMNLILIAVTVLLSVQMIKSLNKIGPIENYYENIGGVPTKTNGQNVGNDSLGNVDPSVMFGHPKGLDPDRVLTKSNSDENAPKDGKGNNTKVLFKHSKCSPECCEMGKGTNYSCDGGCICMDKSQNDIIASRGDGIYPHAPDTNLTYRNKCIINDEFCKNSQ